MREKLVLVDEIEKNSNPIGYYEEASLLKLQECPHEQQLCHQHHHLPPPPPVASPPSASSSPTHEFSFTISLQPQPIKINPEKTSCTTTATATAAPPSFAIDLSPADDIFFHGHLLPLHLLAHLPVSPRSSTNSLDSFTLPIKELLQAQDYDQNNHTLSTTSIHDTSFRQPEKAGSTTRSIKSKSFSIFGLPKWRKTNEQGAEKEEQEDRENNNMNSFSYKKKLRLLEVSHVLKRYMRPLLSFGGSAKRSKMEFPRQSSSYSGNILSARGKAELRRRRGEFSAPSSMRTSPTNSGILLATSGAVSPTKSSDSTMEELQAAIQAAIAHCKKSFAAEEKIHDCQD